MKMIILIAAGVCVSVLASQVAFAQETLPALSDPFYLELNSVRDAFADTTNTDTLKFVQADLTPPGEFWGYEILSSSDVNTLIDDYNLTVDNGDNNTIYEQYQEFTFDGRNFHKKFSYGIERKQYSKVMIDNTYYQDLLCLHIVEKITIDRGQPTPIYQTDNNYFVLYDGTTRVATIAYNENVNGFFLFTQKYIDLPQSGNKSELSLSKYAKLNNNPSEYFTVAPNPATNNLALNVMLKEDDNAIITISDMSGRVIREIKAGAIKKHVKYSHSEDISNLLPGVYQVSLIAPHTTKSITLTIVK